MFVDGKYPRRIVTAFAASLVIHALIIGSGPLHAIPTREEERPTTPVVLEQRTPTPPPPRPTPQPTPKPRPTIALATPHPIRKAVVAAAPRATARPATRRGGSARPKELAQVVPSAAPPTGTATAAGNGLAAGGDGTGAGPGSGNGGAAGAGTGTNGSDQPCGYVTFIPTGAEQYVNGRFYETIRATIEFADGHSESGVFPYPWVYTNQNDDPWAPQNLRKAMHARAQFPPPGATLGDADRVVRLVLQYTRPDGTTTLPLCPGQTGRP